MIKRIEILKRRLIKAVSESELCEIEKAVSIAYIIDPKGIELPECFKLVCDLEKPEVRQQMEEYILYRKAQAKNSEIKRLREIEFKQNLLEVDDMPLPGNIIANQEKFMEVTAILITRRLVNESLEFQSDRTTTNKLCMTGVYYLIIQSDIFKKGVSQKEKIQFLNNHYKINYMKEFYKKKTITQAIEVVRRNIPEMKKYI